MRFSIVKSCFLNGIPEEQAKEFFGLAEAFRYVAIV
jgi:hypothetical protein